MKGLHSQLRGAILICALLIFLTVPLLLCSTAGATVYDDFNGQVIDAAKWGIQGTAGLFSESAGTLHYNTGAGYQSEKLNSQNFNSLHRFSGLLNAQMEFSDFSSSNTSQSGHGWAAAADFIL